MTTNTNPTGTLEALADRYGYTSFVCLNCDPYLYADIASFTVTRTVIDGGEKIAHVVIDDPFYNV